MFKRNLRLVGEESPSLPSDKTNDLAYNHIRLIIKDSIATVVQLSKQLDRPEAFQLVSQGDIDSICDEYYLELLKSIKKKDLDFLVNVLYSNEYLAYEQGIINATDVMGKKIGAFVEFLVDDEGYVKQ